MPNPSPRSHLYRLGGLLVIGLIGFLAVKALATPSSWNHEDWYRGDSPKEIAALPLSYGGNESCQGCHKKTHDQVEAFGHKGLSCESCHGAVVDHAGDGKKIADAKVDMESNWQCMNCHEDQITKPKFFPTFKPTKTHEDVDADMLCSTCHEAHNPGL